MLTDAKARTAKPQDRPYKLTDGGGMYLLVRPNGRKYWQAAYRFGGKQLTLSLGVYPKVSLAAARLALAQAKDLLDQGIDPMAEKKNEAASKISQSKNTFEAVAREWHAVKQGGWVPSTAKATLAHLETYVLPAIGAMRLDRVTPIDVIDLLRSVEARGMYSTVTCLQSIISRVYAYGIITERATTNPARDIGGALRPKPRKVGHAYLPVEDIAKYMRAVRQYPGAPSTRYALELMVYTFVRTKELLGARWEEFDFAKNEWTIPEERMKMRAPHVVPLSRQALSLLAEARLYAPDDVVFPARSAAGVPSHSTLLSALYSMGWRGRATIHGFRALASTVLNEQGWPPDVIERQLAHEDRNRVRAAYNRADYMPQRHKMMQFWADWIDGQAQE